MYNDEYSLDPAFGAAIILMVFFFSIIGILCYIFSAIGFMKMAKKAEIENAWLAWIPIGNCYILGELVTTKLNGKGGIYTVIAAAVTVITSWIPFLGVLIAVVFTIFSFVLYYWLYLKYSNNPILHLVLSIIIPPYAAFAIFALRNRAASY